MLRFAVLLLAAAVAAGPSLTKSRDEIEAFRSYLEGGRTDSGIRLEGRMATNPQAKEWENSGKYQGDILLDEEQVQGMVENFATGRNAYVWPNTKWPANTIPYEFAPGHFSQSAQNAIIDGIRDIEARTCIRFRLRNANDRNFVHITRLLLLNPPTESWLTSTVFFYKSFLTTLQVLVREELGHPHLFGAYGLLIYGALGFTDGCYAHVGYWDTRGAHTLNLAWPGCSLHTTIVHEWLHIIGFLHMQSTHNRDDFVRIMWENIQPGMEYNFDKYAPDLVNNLGLPYDYASTMHYGPYGFSINGHPTMVGLYDNAGVMGQQSYVSAWDWQRANRHYNCPGAWSREQPQAEQPLVEEPLVQDP